MLEGYGLNRSMVARNKIMDWMNDSMHRDYKRMKGDCYG
jgi:hypothetical protein